MKVILASASPARFATLVAAGIRPEVRVSNVDEDAILAGISDMPYPQQVMRLAQAKARASALNPGELVIGADSMLEVDGELVGKPHTEQMARQRIRQMVGKVSVLHTGHAIRCLNEHGEAIEKLECSHARVHMGLLSDAEIDAYVASGEPLKVAGSFTVDGRGGAFVEAIEGDYHGIVGLSLPLLRHMSAEIGVFWPDLWNVD